MRMTKKSFKRQVEESANRKAMGIMAKLDALGAAYTRECKIRPQDACLMVEELDLDTQKKTGKRLKYWFTHHEAKANLQEAHPDVKAVFSYAMDLVAAHAATDVPAIQALLDGLTTYMERYKDDTETKTSVQGGAELQDTVGPSSGDSPDGSN
jgi:hypothetical protein